MIFGGEGLFLVTLRGHGTVYLQSLPFSRLADRIIASAPRLGGRGKEEGSVLGAARAAAGRQLGGLTPRTTRPSHPARRAQAPGRGRFLFFLVGLSHLPCLFWNFLGR